MNLLFVGVRDKGGEDITSAPIKVGNYLFDEIKKRHENTYFYDLTFDNKEKLTIDKNEMRGSIYKLPKILKQYNIDTVYFARFYTLAALMLIIYKLIYRFRLVYTIHGLIAKEGRINKNFRFYNMYIEKILLKACDKIVVPTEGLKDEIEIYYPELNKEKIDVIPDGVSIVKINENIDIRKLYNIEKDQKIIFTIGTRKIKNNEKLLDEFISHKPLYDRACVIVAGELDTDYAKTLLKKYADYSKIKFIGYVSKNLVNNIYRQMDLYVQISEFETFCVSVIEAMLHRKNVLMSAKLPIAQYFNSSEAAFYDESQDDLSDLMLQLVENNRDNPAGAYKSETEFNWNNISDKYFNTFSQL